MTASFILEVAAKSGKQAEEVRKIYSEAKAQAKHEKHKEGSSKFVQRVFELTRKKAGIKDLNEVNE